ncbi:MAG: 4Fe-4S dicluster domain-containing protein [Phycisphaeraceae bacterium JB051]
MPPPPRVMDSQTLRLRLPCDPNVHVGQQLEQGQTLVDPPDRRQPCIVSPMRSRVIGMLHVPDQGYDLTLEPLSPTTSTQLKASPPGSEKLTDWVDCLRRLGQWGVHDGQVGLLVQLEAALLRKPRELICIACDSFAPYPSQSSLAMSHPGELAMGVDALRLVLGLKQASILVGPSRSVYQTMRMKMNQATRLHRVEPKYPIGHPSVVMRQYSQSRKHLTIDGHPLEHDAVIINAWSAIRLARWLQTGELDLIQPLFIGWPQAQSRMHACWVMPGQQIMPLHKRLKAEMDSPRAKLIYGDPLSGKVDTSTDSQGRALGPVVRHDQLLMSLVENPAPIPAQACIACGWCTEVCPTALQPAGLFEMIVEEPENHIINDELLWCIDCGLCSHVCPSAIPLAQSFRQHVKQHLKVLVQ